jgi:hypothetical protein
VRFRTDRETDVEEAEREVASELGTVDSDDEYPGDDVRAVGADVDAALRRGMSSINLTSRSTGGGGKRSGGLSAEDAARQKLLMKGLARMRRENEAEAELYTEQESLAVREAQWAIGLREGLRAGGEWGQHATWRGTLGRHSQGRTVNEAVVPGARGGRPKASDATFHVPVIKYEPTYVALPGDATSFPDSRVPRVLLSPAAGSASQDLVHAAHLISPSAAALAAEAAALGASYGAGGTGPSSFFGAASFDGSVSNRRVLAAGATPSAAKLVSLLGDRGAIDEDGRSTAGAPGRIDARAVLEVAAFREEFQGRPVFAPGELQHLHRQAAARRSRATDGWLRSFRADMRGVRWGRQRHDGLPLGAPISMGSAALVTQQQEELELGAGEGGTGTWSRAQRPSHLTEPHSPSFAASKRRGRYRDTWPAEQAEAELEAMDASRHSHEGTTEGDGESQHQSLPSPAAAASAAAATASRGVAEVSEDDGHHRHHGEMRRDELEGRYPGSLGVAEHKEDEDASHEQDVVAIEAANALAIAALGGGSSAPEAARPLPSPPAKAVVVADGVQPGASGTDGPARGAGERRREPEQDGTVHEPNSPDSVAEIASRMDADAMAAAMQAMQTSPAQGEASARASLQAASEPVAAPEAAPARKPHSPMRITGDFDGLDSHGASAAYEMEP